MVYSYSHWLNLSRSSVTGPVCTDVIRHNISSFMLFNNLTHRNTRVGERWSLHVIKPLVDIGKRSWCERACSINKHNKAQLLLALHLLPVLKLSGSEIALLWSTPSIFQPTTDESQLWTSFTAINNSLNMYYQRF